jgi:hypothetical protein
MLGYSLPQILQYFDIVQLRLSSIERRARRALLHRKQPPKLPADGLTNEYTGDKRYYYAPLDPSDEEIRLLHLSSGTGDEQVSVEISYASLQDRPRYLALSYVWG